MYQSSSPLRLVNKHPILKNCNGHILTLLTSEELERALPAGVRGTYCAIRRLRGCACLPKQKHTGPIFAAPLSRPAIPGNSAPFLSAIC